MKLPLKVSLTLYLCKALPVKAADLAVLLLEPPQAMRQGICDGEVIVLLVAPPVLRVIERRLHLVDLGDDPLGLVYHLLLLRVDQSDLVVEGLR